MNRQPRTLRVCFLTALAIGLTPLAGPGRTSAQNGPEPNALVEVSLMGSGDHIVIGLVGSQALSGEVHEITVAPFRVFVDFVNVIPKVDAVTSVNHGQVKQIRVALNQADPPVTRVVLDLTHRSSYRVEQDPDEHEFRIIVGPAATLTATRPNPPVEPAVPADLDPSSAALKEYAHWFGQLTQNVERLLSAQAAPKAAEGTPPERARLEWQLLQYDVETVTPPIALQVAHDLVETAIRLGRVSATAGVDGSPQEHDRAAARASAALFVARARRIANVEFAANLDSDH